MNTSKFNVGDVVNIKSDKTIKMTVNELKTSTTVGNTIEQSFNGLYECLWFDCTFELKKEEFKEQVLELSN